MPTTLDLSPLSDIAAQLAGEVAGGKSPDGSGVSVADVASQVHKGQPVRLFDRQSIAADSDIAADCRNFNAIRIAVIAWGSSPSAVLTFYGRDEAGGYPIQIAAAGGQTTITATQEIILPVGAAFVSASLSSISGTGAAFTVTVTPFITGGLPSVSLASGLSSITADTELPTAAALADATANPTVPAVGADLQVFNGTTWDRARGDTANGLDVDVSRIQAATSGGATPFKRVSTADTNAASVKASAGQIYLITASNVNAAVRYLKLYDKASAPTVGTDTPVLVFAIPGSTTGGGTNIPIPATGLVFSNGIALALTTGAADSDTGAVAAAEIVVNLGYK